jgi:CDP-diacylglycerol---glycerol-3-phosphate 3-phosphatidyltransferase
MVRRIMVPTDSSSAAPPAAPREPGEGSPLAGAFNVPNMITFSRLGLAVFMFWLIDRGTNWLAATIIFAIAAATDAVDGYIARRYGLITIIGRILDPFADKVIIGGAFVFLAAREDSGINAWMAMIVLGREMFVTSLRSFLEREGKDFSATWSGKIKMILQCAAVAASLLCLEYAAPGASAAAESSWRTARDILVWSAVIVTLYSGYIYIVRAIQMYRRII